jgi:hypothetical protein
MRARFANGRLTNAPSARTDYRERTDEARRANHDAREW